jgi:hypothetical protein
MNFKSIVKENLDNMMADLKSLKDPNQSNVNNPTTSNMNQAPLNVKVVFDKNTNQSTTYGVH